MNKEMISNCISKLRFGFPYTVDEWEEKMYMENYHRHTTYSNVRQPDSSTTLINMMRKVNEYGQKCMFTGEHGWQGSYLRIWSMCHDEKINIPLKFRYSTEAYWVKDRLEKDRTNCHIILVARTMKGIKDINEALSYANIDGFYGQPRLDLGLIMGLEPQDVYITSSCIAGWKYDDAEDIWLSIHKKFGDSFFLEYQPHDTDAQKELNSKIKSLADKHNIQTIIGLDTHYLSDKERIERDNVLKRKGLVYSDEYGWYMDFPDGKETFRRMMEQGVLSEEDIIVSMMNSCVFINGCDEVEFNKAFKIPSLYKQLSHEEKVEKLKEVLLNQYSHEEEQTQERLDGIMYELGQISGSHTEDYFLTNHEIIKLATSEKYGGELTSTSRGSASSFYTSKLLGFTTMDRFNAEVPIFPDRFVTKERIIESHQLPDIDYNCSSQPPFELATKELIGEHGCYPLIAFGELKEKSSWKLYADVNGVDPQTANEVSKHIDEYNETLKYLDEEDKDTISIDEYIPEQYVQIYKDSIPYQGIVENAKVHACGYLLLDGDIRREIGLIRCQSETTGKSTLVTTIDGGLLDEFGYVKNDYLIVDVVAIINKLYKRLGMKVPTVNELRKMVDGDEETWKMYEIGATCCLNQCERSSTTKRVMKYKPKNLKELSAFIAGIRPGFKSLLDGFLNRVDYTTGENAIDKLLVDSFNYMLYQEAVMNIFSYLGIPMKDSYDTIKKISKKKLKGEKLKKVEDSLREHWLTNIGNTDNFEKVYSVVKDSARYSFNAPHALAVSCDSVYEAWVKAHHPSVFYEVTLNHYMDKNDKKKVSELLAEAKTIFGYKLGSFEYGKDNSKFTVDDKEKVIYPNLASIKGIGEKTVNDLLTLYNDGKRDIVSIYMSVKGTSINKTHIRNLIKIGYFKEYGSVNRLLSIIDIVETFGESKEISKEKLIANGYNVDDFLKFGRETAKKIVDLNRAEVITHLICNIPHTEDSMVDIMKNQYEILEFVDYKNEQIKDNVVFVVDVELNRYGTPFFTMYQISNGGMATLKVDKKYFEMVEHVDKFDVIELHKIDTKEKRRQNKETSKWEGTGEYENILSQYSKVIF